MYSDILSGILSDIYSDTLFAIFSGTLESFLASILTFFLILSDILSGILSGIYSHILSAILSEMLSGVRQCHWDLALAVGVRQCLLRSGARRKEERRRREEEEVTLTSRDPQMAGGEWHNMYIYIYIHTVYALGHIITIKSLRPQVWDKPNYSILTHQLGNPNLLKKKAAMMFHPLLSCMNDQAMVNSMSGFGFLGSPGFPFYPFWDSHSGYLIETTGPTTKPNHWLKRRSLERHVLQRVVDCPSPGCRTLRWFSEFSGFGGRNFQSCRVLEKKGPFWSNAAPRQIHVIIFT